MKITTAIAVLVLGTAQAQDGGVQHFTMRWTPPTHNEDGTLITSPLSHRVWWSNDNKATFELVSDTTNVLTQTPFLYGISNHYEIKSVVSEEFHTGDPAKG